MIHDNVEFSNCAEITQGDGFVRFQRVPESVRKTLNPGAQARMLQPASGELRFVADPAEPVKITLSSANEAEIVAVPFLGDYRNGWFARVGQEPQTIELPFPEQFVKMIPELRKRPHTFDPCVVRLMLSGSPVQFHGVEGRSVRPPTRQELPALRYMAYGTSITHGAAALMPHLSYAAQTARRLGADLLNFGSAGSCHCEPELADYLAGREDWDVASLALSVNMVGGFSCEQFEERVRYLVHTIAGSNPGRPVACITLYPFRGDFEGAADNYTTEKPAQFRQILRDAVRDCPTPNAHLVEGPDILQGYSGLTTDLVHPADDGMIQMGENLARVLHGLLASRPSP